MMAQRREAELQEVEEELEEVEDEEDVFDIPAKDPSIQSLREWREASLALNPKRRFRYTTPLRDDLDPRGYVYADAVKKFRRSALLLRAIHRFRQAGLARRASASEIKFLPPPPGFSIGPDRLARIVQDADFDKLGSLGGVPGVASMLATDLQHGIGGDPQDLQRRKAGFGENKYPKTKSKGLLVFLWEACQDTTLIILMICAIVSLISGLVAEGVEHGWHEGLAIGGSVLFVVLLTGITDYRQSLQFRHLNKEKENIQVQVVRAGRTVQVSIFDLVVGDIVSLNIGGQIPADGVLVSGHSLTLDESSMTGESDPVHKDSNHPFMMSGVKVVDGHGTMMVTGVGMNTEWGQVMATLSDDIGGETPLQVRLSGLATFIGKFGVCVAAIVLCVLIIRYFATKFKKERSAGSVVNDVIDIFSTVVTLVVVAVPEGLPLAVTLTLSYSMSRMMADKSLVRRLAACETMGSATTICSDKTGTLTLNQMSAVKSWVAGHFRDPEEVKAVHGDVYSIVADNIALNTVGSVFTPEDGGEPEVTGSPTEAALLSWGLKVGVNFDVVQSSASILHVETFNSTKKRAGVGVRLGNGNVRAYWKGAAEIILEQCTQWIDDKNQVLPLTPEKVSEIAQLIEGMAAGSLRCVALAYQNIGPEEVPTSEDDSNGWQLPDNNLIFVGVVGIKDPCRPGVREAVAVCQAAGIKVRMVTGDNMVTAKAIAHECGILTADGVAVEGKVFRNYSEEQIFALLPKLDVMARSSPTDKLMLVKMLKKFRANNVVAVTGDGTNDAPALHEADIGLSMGISGTEVAKESSDIIILDDKFTSVVKVVRWGRSVYANIQKYIQFQLTVNVVALSLNLITALSTGEVPLNAVQLLWVNMVMGTLGALALATEPPNNRLMRQRPIGRKDPLVSNAMLRNIVGQATYQILVLLILYYAFSKILNFRGTEEEREARRNTIVFNTFVFCQIFNEFNARRPNKMNVFEGITGNHIFLVIIALTIIMQFVIVQYFDDFSGTTNLTWQQWLLCIILGSLSWPLAALVKLIPVRSKPYLTKTAIRRKLRKWKLLKSRRGTGPENGNGDLEQVPQQPSGSVL